MEEYRENNNDKSCNCTNHNSGHWIKFALLLLALFLASYLAVYYILDQMRHAYYIPSAPVENIDRIIKEQDKMFERDFGALPMHDKAFKDTKNTIETYYDNKSNSYKMIINLKEFDNNPQNITLDIKKDKVNVTGINEKITKKREKVYTFSQTFILPEKIKTELVTKEKTGNKYIITMPLENEINDDIED